MYSLLYFELVFGSALWPLLLIFWDHFTKSAFYVWKKSYYFEMK